MNDRSFFDTNIIVYAFRKDADPRGSIARDLLDRGGKMSVQVLNEFTSVARRKLGMTWKEVSQSLAALRVLSPDPIPVSVSIHEAALAIAERYGYHIYDANVIAAALASSCSVLYSEDLRSGHTIRGLTIRNPF
jgi:predicted nucleic acid-binding protein